MNINLGSIRGLLLHISINAQLIPGPDDGRLHVSIATPLHLLNRLADLGMCPGGVNDLRHSSGRVGLELVHQDHQFVLGHRLGLLLQLLFGQYIGFIGLKGESGIRVLRESEL